MRGKLTLVPLPLYDQDPICSKTKSTLEDAVNANSIILVEELKPCRRRWINYGLPRKAIDSFLIYNEHNQIKASSEIISFLKSGKDVLLMSDCGLPAFCDPGTHLISLCHENQIPVTATPYANSISLALAISGINHDRFLFAGFLSNKAEKRKKELVKLIQEKDTVILMDTPYRFNKLLAELDQHNLKREVFIATDLNEPTELCFKGHIKKAIEKFSNQKRKFILILGSSNE